MLFLRAKKNLMSQGRTHEVCRAASRGREKPAPQRRDLAAPLPVASRRYEWLVWPRCCEFKV